MKPNALKEGLREQTIIIEDCTAELKAMLSKAVFSTTALNSFLEKAYRLIDERLSEMTDEDLKKSAEETLKHFARKEFGRLRANLMAKQGFNFIALALVMKIWNSDSANDKQAAFEKLQAIEPSLARLPPTQFEQGRGNSRRWGLPLNEYMDTYMERVNSTCRMLANDVAKDSDGLSLRLKSELYVRYKWQQDNLDRLKASGQKLVWISSHVNCSERCQDYQGRLYSMDGTSGRTEDGHSYVPLEVATDRYYTTKKGRVWKNGTLTGFGCRHYTIPYEPHGVTPETFDDSEIEEALAIEKEQRRLEREVYHAREDYYSYRGNNTVLAMKYYRKAMIKRKEYIKFCTDNKVAWYPSRIQVNP